MEVIVNLKQSKVASARQLKAWDEFLDMLLERAEAKLKKKGLVNIRKERYGNR
jgi:hypothetical protein